MDKEMVNQIQSLIEKNIIDVSAMEVGGFLNKGVPTGLIRYFLQCKEGEGYLKSDMTRNLIFYMPFNQSEASQMTNDIKGRNNVIEEIKKSIISDNTGKHIKKDPYVGVLIELSATNETRNIINLISINQYKEEIATALQNISNEIKKDLEEKEEREFDIVLGVVHGVQVVNEETVRPPHIHILLMRCKKTK